MVIMDAEIIVYFFNGKFDAEDDDGYHFGIETKEEIPTEKYVKFCKCLQTALDVLNGKEE